MFCIFLFFFFNDTATTEIYTLSLHDALPISYAPGARVLPSNGGCAHGEPRRDRTRDTRMLEEAQWQGSGSVVWPPEDDRRVRPSRTGQNVDADGRHSCVATDTGSRRTDPSVWRIVDVVVKQQFRIPDIR